MNKLVLSVFVFKSASVHDLKLTPFCSVSPVLPLTFSFIYLQPLLRHPLKMLVLSVHRMCAIHSRLLFVSVLLKGKIPARFLLSYFLLSVANVLRHFLVNGTKLDKVNT